MCENKSVSNTILIQKHEGDYKCTCGFHFGRHCSWRSCTAEQWNQYWVSWLWILRIFLKLKLLLSDLISTKMRALQLLSSNGYGNSYSNGMMSSYNGGYPTNGFSNGYSNGYSNGIMPSYSNYNSYPSNGYSAYPSNSNLGCTTCPRYYSSMYNSYPTSMYRTPYAGNYGYNGLNSIGKK